MKKLFIIIAAFALSLSLAGCGNDTELKAIPDEVTMTEVDEYLGRPDVQYVDLRNFDDKMKSGYIAGFEMIPFFDYLEYEEILVRTDGDWTFAAADILNAAALRGLFDEEKTIFLMCGSGTRAGYVMAALESLGYTDVYNVGGISAYLDGDAVNAVLGDDTYSITMDTKGDFTPGTYFGFDPIGGYMTTVVIGPAGGIVNVVFDAVYGNSTKQDMGDAYMLGSGISWATEADELAAYIIANQGWGEIIIDETDLTGLNADTVPHHFIEINHDGTVDAVAGVSIGAEGFVLSWNAAIAKASTTDLGVVVLDATAADWAAAHEPAFAYTDGVYFGNDPMSGYFVQVTVEDGFIVDVFFDAVYHDSTKQTLGTGYTLGSGITWAAEADELAEYLVDNQGWGEIILDETDLTGLNADTVPSHFIEINHDGAVDAVAGVSIGAEGFVLAWNAAISQASTTDHGVVVLDASPADWAAAHEPAFAYTDGVYYGSDPLSGYFVQLTVKDGFIIDVFFDASYHGSTKQTLGTAYTLGSGSTWAEEANELAAYLLDNQGWGEIILDETDLTGLNALTVPHHYIEINHDGAVDAVAGVTIGTEGFVLAWNAAISQASDSDHGVVALVADADAWAAAHAPYINYTDGTYFGISDGYSALITVLDGQIADIFLDAQHGVDTDEDGIKDLFNSKQGYALEDYLMNQFINDDGNAELKLASSILAIEIAGLETTHASYSTQVYQEGFAFENGTQYRVTFDAYADAARQMNVNLGDALDGAPYFTNFMTTAVIDLTTSVQTFTIDFTMTEATTADQGKLVFELGAIAGVAVNTVVYLDNVMIEEFDGAAVVAETDQVVNGDFASKTTNNWGMWTGDEWSGVNTSTLLRGGHNWWTQVDMLEEAIIDAQEWAWNLDDGDFDVDGVAGVSIGVGHWEAAIVDAYREMVTATGTLFFSEIIEGSSNNKAIEIYNYGTGDVDLSAYSVRENYGSGSNTLFLEGTLEAGDVYVICTDQAGAEIIAECDLQLGYPSVSHFNGDDSLQLAFYGVVVDQFIPEADAGSGDTAKDIYAEHTFVRNATVTNGVVVFDLTEWTVLDQNDFTELGSHNE